MSLRYLEYNASRTIPNVVVDGSPNEGTVLTLTHWPGMAQSGGLAADLSAQMAFRFVRNGVSAAADVVTNNHLDQDGLVAMYALVEPAEALRHQELLVDVAAAGDFGTYRYRQAARASMAIATYADPERSPIAAELTGPYEVQCAVLYERLLERLLDIVLRPEEFSELWIDEDRQLTASEAALATGAITIEERADVDLAIVDIAASEPQRRGHRFAADEYVGVHPMASTTPRVVSGFCKCTDVATPTRTATSPGCSTSPGGRCHALTCDRSPNSSPLLTPRSGLHRVRPV